MELFNTTVNTYMAKIKQVSANALSCVAIGHVHLLDALFSRRLVVYAGVHLHAPFLGHRHVACPDLTCSYPVVVYSYHLPDVHPALGFDCLGFCHRVRETLNSV
jgi:hypothetical protein